MYNFSKICRMSTKSFAAKRYFNKIPAIFNGPGIVSNSNNKLSTAAATTTIPITNNLENIERQEDLTKTINSEDFYEEINKALQHPDYFNVHNLFTVQDLFNARVHYGHKVGSLDEYMKRYVYGIRLGHIIFDLDNTAVHLRKALNFTAHIAYRDGIILFLNRGAQNAHLVEQTAIECKEFSHTRFWRGGVFTNANSQFKAVTRLPDLCIFLNTLNNVMTQHTAVRDAAKMSIPTIGIVDSNCDPNLITYPVPGNDDSTASIQLYCKLFKEAILRGKAKRVEVQNRYLKK